MAGSEMLPSETFWWGFAGSVAVEIIALLGFYHSSPVRIPDRYRRIGFWITRLILAALAGALAVGYGIEERVLAFNIGASTPLIISSLARGFRPRIDEPGHGVPAPAGSGRAHVARRPVADRRT